MEKKSQKQSKEKNQKKSPKAVKRSSNKDGSRCSGYGVFPDGAKCKGCSDCGFGKEVMTMKEIKRDINSRSVRVSKGDTLEDIFNKIDKKRNRK